MKQKYVIGIDFGTLSARGILLEAFSGKELAEATSPYRHGVMDQTLSNGMKLPDNYALQDPQDYIDALIETIHAIIDKSKVNVDDIVGLGIDFTSCTLLSVDDEGIPLCFEDKFKDNPHAYVKLWKHHGAQKQADLITQLAIKRNEKWLPIYGNKVSSEWVLPKILETLENAPEVFEATARFMEAADWLSLLLTGKESHSGAFAGYKALWNKQTGYPSNDFMVSLDSRLNHLVGTKLSDNVLSMDQMAGTISQKGSKLTGLSTSTVVSLPMIDAHASLPASGVIEDGDMMMILGTSTCLILNSKKQKQIDGICGYVKDGVIPGFYTYEAGQAAVGDIFEWFITNCVPESYTLMAKQKGIGIHELLTQKASLLKPMENKLIALDWLNGNRSLLSDSNLSGLLLGLTLQTKPEEIYRALIEATAYGARMIVEQYEQNGIPIHSICAAGGIAKKNEMLMQIYADVLGKKIRVSSSNQSGALGSAIYASVAAKLYPDIKSAVDVLSKPDLKIYEPIPENQEKYNVLFHEYKILHDYFGKGDNPVMKILANSR